MVTVYLKKRVTFTILTLQVDTEDGFVEKALELANDESRCVEKLELLYSRRPVRLLKSLNNVRPGHRPDVLNSRMLTCRRQDLRRSLRSRMMLSPLCNGEQHAADLEAAYRDMWLAYVDSA